VRHLVLGSGFDARDFAAYTAGVALAVLLERAARRRGHPAAIAAFASLPLPSRSTPG